MSRVCGNYHSSHLWKWTQVVLYQGRCLRSSSLHGWITHIFYFAIFIHFGSMLSPSFHLPGPISSFTGCCLTGHPSLLFSVIHCFNAFSLSSPTVFPHWGRRSFIQKWKFIQVEKPRGYLQNGYLRNNLGEFIWWGPQQKNLCQTQKFIYLFWSRKKADCWQLPSNIQFAGNGYMNDTCCPLSHTASFCPFFFFSEWDHNLVLCYHSQLKNTWN